MIGALCRRTLGPNFQDSPGPIEAIHGRKLKNSFRPLPGDIQHPTRATGDSVASRLQKCTNSVPSTTKRMASDTVSQSCWPKHRVKWRTKILGPGAMLCPPYLRRRERKVPNRCKAVDLKRTQLHPTSSTVDHKSHYDLNLLIFLTD